MKKERGGAGGASAAAAAAAEYKQYQYKSCGFMEPRYIQDYPIRNMLVKLKIRRRRWEIIIEGEKKKCRHVRNTYYEWNSKGNRLQGG